MNERELHHETAYKAAYLQKTVKDKKNQGYKLVDRFISSFSRGWQRRKEVEVFNINSIHKP